MTVTSYFEVEPLIVQHIQENMPDVPSIDTPFDIDDMLANSSNDDLSVSVIYHGYRMGNVIGKGIITNQYQQWLIVLKAYNQEGQSSNANLIRKTADPYIMQLLNCMQGFDPRRLNPELKAYRQFSQADSPVGAGMSSSFGYFPFLFEIQMFV